MDNKEQKNLKGKNIFKERKKSLAPPPPAIIDFEQRINNLRIKGKRRGKRYSIIGITSSIVIAIGVIIGSYYLLAQITNIDKKINGENSKVAYPIIDPEGRCSDDCCLSSLLRIRRNRYKEYDAALGCPFGYEKKILACPTSLSWCVPKKKHNIIASTTKVENTGGNGLSNFINSQIASTSLDKLATSTDILATTTDKTGLDSDNDGLSDKKEIKYGTDPNNPDTDGDGYLDGDEVKNGYNPLGKGKLK